MVHLTARSLEVEPFNCQVSPHVDNTPRKPPSTKAGAARSTLPFPSGKRTTVQGEQIGHLTNFVRSSGRIAPEKSSETTYRAVQLRKNAMRKTSESDRLTGTSTEGTSTLLALNSLNWQGRFTARTLPRNVHGFGFAFTNSSRLTTALEALRIALLRARMASMLMKRRAT